MKRWFCTFATAVSAVVLVSCERPAPLVQAATTPAAAAKGPDAKHEVRVSGVIQAVHSSKVLVPQIAGQYNRMTLTRIIAGGTHVVAAGDPIASFDATVQMDAARDAQAKFDDLGHQADQKRAQNRADARSAPPICSRPRPISPRLKSSCVRVPCSLKSRS
jgi:hypothetical protein